MFRKAPLKTYQRKKGGGASTTINPSSIIREDISDNKDLQPKEFLAFKDSDTSLEYDPFDTTFDRIARDVKMPPIPQNPDDDSYSSSSYGTKNSSLDDGDLEPLPNPLPIINPKPVPVRRNFKKLKLDESASTIKIELKKKEFGGKYRNDTSFNENTEPNVQQKSGKKRKNMKDSKEPKNVTQKKRRRVAEKPVFPTYRGKRDKILDTSKSFKRCSVNLTRVDISLIKPPADSNSANNISNREKPTEKMDVSYFSKEENLKPLVKEQSTSLGEDKNTIIFPNPTPKQLVEDQKMSLGEEENTSTFKNPTVSLTRLNVPQPRVSVANKLWLNSTPMTTKKLRPKSSLRFSPISTDKSMETTDHNEDGSYEGQNLPPEKSNVQSKNFTPKNTRSSRFSNRSKRNVRNSTKSKPLLSVSPDLEPSGLMFDDSEIMAPSADSYASLEKSENKNAAEASTMSPFMGFPKGPPEVGNKNTAEASTMSPFLGFSKCTSEVLVAESRPSFRTVLAPIGNYNNTIEASTTSPFKGFTKDSTDSGSMVLIFDESDKMETSSKELTRSLEKTRLDVSASRAPPEDQESKIKEAPDPGIFRRSEKVEQKSAIRSPKIRLSRLEKSAINLKDFGKRLQNSSKVSPKDLQNTSKVSPKDLQISSKVSPKDLQNTAKKSAQVLKKDSEESIEVPQNSSEEMTEVLQSSSEVMTEVLQSSSEESTEVLQNNSEKSTQVLKDSSNESVKDWLNNSNESAKSLQSTLNESAKSLQSSLNESAESLQGSLNERGDARQDSSKEKTKNQQTRLTNSVKNRQSKSKRDSETYQDSSQDDSIDLQIRFTKNLRNRQSSSKLSLENPQTILKEKQQNRQSILDLSAYDTKNISKEIAQDWESSLDECSQVTTEQTNSDGEWETTTESPRSNSASVKNSENTTAQHADNKSVLQVSSDEGNTSYDDSVELVNASQSFSPTEYESYRQEISSFGDDESCKAETFSESKVKAGESSVLGMTYDQKIFQPVVLLTRCSVPIRTSKRTSHYKNTQLKKTNVSVKSIKELSSENEDDDVERSMNHSLASESIDWKNGNEQSQDMSSVSMDELSENGTEIEESAITEVFNRDSINGSVQNLTRKVGSANERSSKKMEVDKRNEEESFKDTEVNVRKSLVEEKPVKILAKDTLEDSRPAIQPVVLLNRLNDNVRVGDRRKKYRNWGLSAISEDLPGQNVTTIHEEPEEFEPVDTEKNETKTDGIKKKPRTKLSGNRQTVLSQETTVSCDASVLSNQSNVSIKEDKVVFLKPGKSWSRSLSLFRQVHSQDDLESLAIGKGKKWRQSVQAVLDMQQQGVIQSCVKKNADDKESRSCYGVRNSAAAWIPGSSQPNASGVFSQTSVGSPGRFIRRISIRVVPDRKNSELYEDSPFLEAYGITSCENRKTIGKRSTLIAPRKTLVYNVKCADVSFENIPKSLNSVTSRDVVLAQCGQVASVPFEEFYPDSYLKHCRKIGEGVFGEVFLYEKGAVKNVIKIIPIEGELKVNGERQKKFDEILSEIVIAKELNNLRFADNCKTSSFVEVKNIRCVVGNYPQMLIDLWNMFDTEKNSENDCPEMFDKDQLYIVLELGHGGQDLEAFVFQNSSEAHALFIQTALALAVAEDALEFEHRDLHWGNILISRTEDSQISYKLRDKDIKVASKGVKVSVIDFTLSRMSYQGCSIFNDLSLDDDLFAAQGEYQFEIYRLMRHKVENNWQTFEPFTNILWLHYTLDKMITAVRYRRTSTKIHKSGIDKLKVLKDEILNYKSAFDFVTNCDNVTRLQGSRSNISTVSSTD